MLFALEWIRTSVHALADMVEAFLGGGTLRAFKAALTRSVWTLAAAVVAGVTLCFFGFRRHKAVSGLAGGAVLGGLGWLLGQTLNAESITVPLLYALLLGLPGFLLFYSCYVLAVLPAAFLLAWASLAEMPGISATGLRLGAAGFALAYCFCYVRDKRLMSALTGALLLGLTAGGLYGAITGSAVCAGCTAAGIWLQGLLKRRYEAKKAAERTEERRKYPPRNG